ncbi:MAG: 3-hydroxyacyl-CoA dehydrogenase family protein [Deltaproteobacteria bacterium]|nr:3-hydroxyacyl-CoA dehydrogenase family protein [Deltaproteobacteria bacterium]
MIKRIFVAGAGLMGGGIAQVCAQAGYEVTIRDLTDELIEKGLLSVRWSAGKLVEKGKTPGTVDEIMGRITGTTDLSAAASADFVFEAVVEDLAVKRQLFADLDAICPPYTVFASNTSAIPITKIAGATNRKTQFLGAHFFSPVPMMRIVELIRTAETSEETIVLVEEICQSLGKETIRVNRDVAGFALNRINYPSSVEAIRLVEAGVVSVEDVDKGMRLGFGRPMGPFETSDMAGLDVAYNAYKAVYEETGDEKFKPPEIFRKKVERGELGRKTGIGWYRYDGEGKKLGPADLPK